jgi:phosphocarrier protein|tara:strand:+ start:9874 stop:10167 length:294 start_codon:yes stop_codon:yes gene_type:complete
MPEKLETMQQIVLTIVNPLGLHARAASKFVDCAKHFESTITLATDGNEVDGKSIMKLLLLGAPVGTQVTLRVVGADEECAFRTACELINAGFGELED